VKNNACPAIKKIHAIGINFIRNDTALRISSWLACCTSRNIDGNFTKIIEVIVNIKWMTNNIQFILSTPLDNSQYPIATNSRTIININIPIK
jgi:hypothetical protein